MSNPIGKLEANRLWDVAIIGAGPAGSTAAVHLGRNNHNVLLLDKDSFPRDKICGDALIPDAARSLKKIELYEEVRNLGYRASLTSVYSPSRIKYDIPGEFITLKRYILDALVVKKAIASGVAFCQRKVTNIKVQPDGTLRLSVKGADRSIRSRVALIATGASVDLAAKLGLVTQQGPSAIALRCYVRSPIELDRLIISYDHSITPGYAWIFPLGNGEFNIGCGLRYRDNIGAGINLREIFHLFTKSFPAAADIMRKGEILTPLSGAMLRCNLSGTYPIGPGNILVIGETVGATFPFTGEGIGKAMETGELAARIVHEALLESNFQKLEMFSESLEYEMKPKFLGYQIAENWFSRPWLNDFIARRITRSRFLQEAVAGIVNETVDPRRIFSLRGILRSFMS